jgi:hypothetical protein
MPLVQISYSKSAQNKRSIFKRWGKLIRVILFYTRCMLAARPGTRHLLLKPFAQPTLLKSLLKLFEKLMGS